MKLTFISAAYEPELRNKCKGNRRKNTHTERLIFALSTQQGAKTQMLAALNLLQECMITQPADTLEKAACS